MLMRYHFGFGVGHVYFQRPATSGLDHSSKQGSRERDIGGDSDKESLDDGHGPCDLGETVQLEQEQSSSDDSTTDDDNLKDSQDDLTDDDEFYALEEMYGI
jgi:hypothetical protein